MSLLKDFKDFLVKGNAFELAVGVIIAGAFGKIVDSLIKDILMPPIGLALGGVDFSNLYAVLSGSVPAGTALAEAQKLPGVVVLAYGNFIMTILNFIVIAFCIFMLIRGITKAREMTKKNEKPAEVLTKTCPFCQSEINIKATRCPQCTSELEEHSH